MQAIPGVANVHDLHVWAFGTKRVAMTVHLVSDNRDAALEAAQKIAAKHGITHSTIQTEQCGECRRACSPHPPRVDYSLLCHVTAFLTRTHMLTHTQVGATWPTASSTTSTWASAR